MKLLNLLLLTLPLFSLAKEVSNDSGCKNNHRSHSLLSTMHLSHFLLQLVQSDYSKTIPNRAMAAVGDVTTNVYYHLKMRFLLLLPDC